MLKRILEILLRIEKQLQEQQKQTGAAPVTGDTKATIFKPAIDASGGNLQTSQDTREIIFKAKEEALKITHQAQEESRKIYEEARKLEEQLAQREGNLAHKIGSLEERDRILGRREKEIGDRLMQIDKIKKEELDKLEQLAGIRREEAKQLVLDMVKNQMQEEVAKEIREAQNRAKEEADKNAQEVLVEAMQRAATDYVAEYTVSTVKIADEEIKGRIIGKEGRNIRAFEQATGVDVDLDETPNVIRLSSFDSVRREVARVALEKLIADGRIQPERIEEIVKRTRQELEKIMFTEGEKLCHSVGVYNLPVDIIALLGRFKYRFSYGQNMIAHTMEETKIGIALANAVGADVNIVRLGCLLHDIGKVITDKEGTHVQLGVELLRKYNIPEAVVHCVASHHEDIEFKSSEAVLVYIADAISGSRPGARYEDYDEYIKRLTDLEDIAKTKEGVETAYAFQAGRELRVIVKPDKLSDAATVLLSHQIAAEIKEKIKNYPGQIKVTVIREMRTSDVVN
ncbi:MAG: ribonuclease Y [Patescibacteria group bacterium]|nr:ribonuclease Y [Patescibacteria group bacterium]